MFLCALRWLLCKHPADSRFRPNSAGSSHAWLLQQHRWSCALNIADLWSVHCTQCFLRIPIKKSRGDKSGILARGGSPPETRRKVRWTVITDLNSANYNKDFAFWWTFVIAIARSTKSVWHGRFLSSTIVRPRCVRSTCKQSQVKAKGAVHKMHFLTGWKTYSEHR